MPRKQDFQLLDLSRSCLPVLVARLVTPLPLKARGLRALPRPLSRPGVLSNGIKSDATATIHSAVLVCLFVGKPCPQRLGPHCKSLMTTVISYCHGSQASRSLNGLARDSVRRQGAAPVLSPLVTKWALQVTRVHTAESWGKKK